MWTLTSERSNRVYRSEEYGVAVDEARSIPKLEYRETLLVVQARLVDTDVVVER